MPIHPDPMLTRLMCPWAAGTASDGGGARDGGGGSGGGGGGGGSGQAPRIWFPADMAAQGAAIGHGGEGRRRPRSFLVARLSRL